MKNIAMKLFLFSACLLLPSLVSAVEMNELPAATNGVITLSENVELSNAFTIREDVVIDLNGKVLKLLGDDNKIYANVEIKNGVLDVSGVTVAGDAIIGIGDYSDGRGILTLDSVNFIGKDYSSAYAVVYLYGNSSFNVNNSVLEFDTDFSELGGVIKSKDGIVGNVNIISSQLYFTDTVRGILDGTVLIQDSDVVIKGTVSGGLDNAFNTTAGGLALTFDNSEIEISGAVGRGITLHDTTLTVKNETVINISDCDEGDIFVKDGDGVINADSTITINGEIKLGTNTSTLEITGGKYSHDVSAYVADDYMAKEVNGQFIVSKEFAIVVENVSNGTLSVSQNKGFVGDVITVNTVAENGYYLNEIVVLDEKGDQVTVTNNTFVMPDGAVSVVAHFKKIVISVKVPIVDLKKDVDKITVGVVTSSAIEKILLDELAKSKIDTTNKNVELVFEAHKVDVKKDVKRSFEENVNKVNKNVKIADYFELSVTVKDVDANKTFGTLDNMSSKIKLTVVLPKELQANDEVLRNYYIVKNTNGVIELIDTKLSENGKSIEFETEAMTTYALAYEDVENPATGDNIGVNIMQSIVLLISGLGLYLKRKVY